jgi:hypothetical protein
VATRVNPDFASLVTSRASNPTSSSSVRLIGSTALPPHELEQEVVAWSDSVMLEHEADAAQNPTLKLIPRIIQYIQGTQWPSRSTAYGTSRPVSNKMFRQYWELISLLTDGKPESRIKVYDAPDSYSEIQAQLQEFLKIFAATPDYSDALQDIIAFGLLAKGVGKIQWNSRLRGGMGDVELKFINPMNLFTLSGDGSLDSAELVTEREIISMAALRRAYDRLVDGVKPDDFAPTMNLQSMKPGQLSSAEWAKFSPLMRKWMGRKGMSANTEQHFPMVTVRKHWLLDPATNDTKSSIYVGRNPKGKETPWGYWVEPGQLLFPRGRLMVVAGGKVMNDTCNPYYHAKPPYIDFTPLRGPWSPEGMSLMGQLLSPQDVINRIMAGLLETIKASLLPTLLAPRESMSQTDLEAMSTTISGGKFVWNANRSPSPPIWRPAPEVPSLALNFLQIEMREMDQTSGAAAVDAAAQKEQVPSKDTMEMIQNSRSSIVRVMGRSFERFLNRGGALTISNMLQFYSVGHRVAILGERGITPMDFAPFYGSLMKEGMAPEEFVRKFEYSVRPGSALDFEKDTKIQMAMLLRQSGDLSRANLFRALDANIDQDQNTRELITEAMQKIAVGALAQQAQQAGQPQGGGGGGK